MRPERVNLVRALSTPGEPPPSDRLARDLIGANGFLVDLTVLYGYLWRRREVPEANPWIEQALYREVQEDNPRRDGEEKSVERDDCDDCDDREDPCDPDEVRLYLTERLDDYIKLKDEDIRYWRKVSNEGGTLVWVRADLKLYRVRTHRDEAQYLAGDIADAHLPGAGAEPGAAYLAQGRRVPETATCSAWTHPC